MLLLQCKCFPLLNSSHIDRLYTIPATIYIGNILTGFGNRRISSRQVVPPEIKPGKISQFGEFICKEHVVLNDYSTWPTQDDLFKLQYFGYSDYTTPLGYYNGVGIRSRPNWVRGGESYEP